MTQYQIIKNVLADAKDWVVSHQLEKVSTKYGWLGTSALKRCRELQVKGEIEKKMEGGYVWYKSRELPPPKPVVSNYQNVQLSLI